MHTDEVERILHAVLVGAQAMTPLQKFADGESSLLEDGMAFGGSGLQMSLGILRGLFTLRARDPVDRPHRNRAPGRGIFAAARVRLIAAPGRGSRAHPS